MKATCKVVPSELHAEPERNQPWLPLLDAESGAEILQRRRVVAADIVHKATDQDDAVDRRGQDQPGDDDRETGDVDCTREQSGDSSIALARDRHITAPAEPPALQQKGGEREGEQYDRQHRGLSLVLRRTDHGE